MRGTASAFYILTVTFIGLALGPYTMGKLSDVFINRGYDPTESLRYGIMIGLFSYVFAAVFLFLSAKHIEKEETTRLERAREAGEPGLD